MEQIILGTGSTSAHGMRNELSSSKEARKRSLTKSGGKKAEESGRD
jgi:hypothetical protein